MDKSIKPDKMVLGAIDIGSNAVRLLIDYIREYEYQTVFKKAAFVRVPLRLGEDVFVRGRIGEEKKILSGFPSLTGYIKYWDRYPSTSGWKWRI